jgi:MarR family transcriptional regulator, transcriptional regulator for hemolysin
MSSRSDPDTFGFLLTDAARLVRQEFDREIGEAGLGLTPGEARALSHAARAGTVRQNVLADRMGVEAMTLSSYLDRLEAHGLIRRTIDPTDRRAKLVCMTETSEDMLARIREIGMKARARAERSMTAAEWETLQMLLKRVRAELSGGREETGNGAAA